MRLVKISALTVAIGVAACSTQVTSGRPSPAGAYTCNTLTTVTITKLEENDADAVPPGEVVGPDTYSCMAALQISAIGMSDARYGQESWIAT